MRTIKISLSPSSINQAREQLTQEKDWIVDKARQLAVELAEYGIRVAERNTGEYWGKFIEFVMETDETKTGCKAIMIMRDATKIVPKHDKKAREVSPSLMAEYGSGKWAIDDWRGTFPEQIHAFDPKGWWYQGEDDKWHHTYGVPPHRPMYTAYMQMLANIDEVIKRVFV